MHKVYRKICLIIPKTPILIGDLLLNVIFVVFSHDDSHKVKKRSKRICQAVCHTTIAAKRCPDPYKPIGRIPVDSNNDPRT